jgi:hypothetical protein
VACCYVTPDAVGSCTICAGRRVADVAPP